MARVPILHPDEMLIATMQENLRDRDAQDLQADRGAALERTGVRGVILALAVVATIGSYLGRVLGEIALVCRPLGAHTVVVGMQPAVAITLTERDVELRGVRAALNVRQG